MNFRSTSLLALLAWTASVAAEPQTPEIATMPIGRTPAQIGIPSDLARHTAGRDRRVDRSTAEAAIRQMWLAVNGRVQHPSLAVQGELNRITKQYEQHQQGASLLEGATGEQESQVGSTDEAGKTAARSDTSSFVSTQDSDDTSKEIKDATEKYAKDTKKLAEDYIEHVTGSRDRLDASKGDPLLYISDSSVALAKLARKTTENARKLGIDNSIKILKQVFNDPLGTDYIKSS